MDPGPMTEVESEAAHQRLEALKFRAVEPETIPAAAETTPPVGETPAPADETKPPKVKPMTLEEMRKFEPTKDVVAGLEARIVEAEEQAEAARETRDTLKHEAGRARTEAANARQLHERYQRALREAGLEFNAAGVRTTVDVLTAQPAELPSLVRRLARTVKDITPDRDALRREVARLNGEAMETAKALSAKDVTIDQLRKDVEAGLRREELLKQLPAQMQTARDSAQAERDAAIAEKDKAERALTTSRAKVAELEGTIARLQTSAKQEVRAS